MYRLNIKYGNFETFMKKSVNKYFALSKGTFKSKLKKKKNSTGEPQRVAINF